MKKFNIGLIGLGDIAQKAYLPIIANHHKISPWLVTRNPKTLSTLEEKYRPSHSFTNVQQLIKAKPDAAMVHSATESHYSVVKALLSAGIATLVDKPLSLEINQCAELCQLALEKNVPLYLAMNRRHAPLIATLKNRNARHIRWQKNRPHLLENPKQTIFNDFIHVVDGLCFLSGASLADISQHIVVHFSLQDGCLLNIVFHFRYNGALFEGSMNRCAGVSEERIEFFAEDEKFEINNLTSGWHYEQEKATPLSFNDWQSYLYIRGFEIMVEDWLKVIKSPSQSETHITSALLTHQVCQLLLERINEKLAKFDNHATL